MAKRKARPRCGCPDDARLRHALARAEAGDLIGAERACAELLDDLPTHIEGLRLRAAICCELGRRDAAVSGLRRAVQLAPSRADLRLALGRLLREQGDLEGAEREVRAAREASPELGAASFELGRICSLRSDLPQAIACYERAAQQAELVAASCYNLGTLLSRTGQLEQAVEAYRRALRAQADDAASQRGLARALHGLRRQAEAHTAYERLLRLEPQCEEAAHMAAALGGAQTEGCPEGYVRELFDAHAERFDHLLVEQLGYRTHRLLAQMICAALPTDFRFDRAVDLGCGTGLFGAEIRPCARQLVGVDLSPRMLDAARARGVYDELHCAALPAWLERPLTRWDLLAAADVLPYFGHLERLFDALGHSVARGGIVALSVETTTEGPYRLRPSGRYAHCPDYVRELARRHGLSPLVSDTGPLRRDGNEEVMGTLLVLQST